VDDPHVARLLDGVAFLAARVHHRLDDEFPELTDALLACCIRITRPGAVLHDRQLDCSPDLQLPDTRPVGTEFDTEPVRGEALRYRTTAPVTLWPIEVRMSASPACRSSPPPTRRVRRVAALRITLKCLMPDMTFAQLGVDRLRFFLQGPSNQTLPLYELLGGHVLSVAFADSAIDPNPVIVPAQVVQPAGFADDEALLPWSARGFSGFRLLTEYFTFPEKFLFIDIGGIDKKTLATGGNRLKSSCISIAPSPSWSAPSASSRWLWAACRWSTCSPPLRTDRHHPYGDRISHRARRAAPAIRRGLECRARAETLPDGSSRPWRPFHRLTESDPIRTFPAGSITRQAHRVARGPGTEVFLAPHDPGFDPAAPANATLSVDALCLNRDLPTDLPYGAGGPRCGWSKAPPRSPRSRR